MAHWRAKYSEGRSTMSGQKPPNDSACSSRRSSQKGPSRPRTPGRRTRRPGCRSSTPKAMSCAQASISSKECDTAWRISGLKGRSEPRVGTMTELPSWMPIGHVELLGRLPHRVVGAVGQRAAAAGVGTDEAGDEAELGHGAAQLAGRRRRVLQREQGRPEEPARIGGAVAGQPVVVGGGQGHGGRRVLDGGEVEADGGVQDGLVDALAVHVVQAGRRGPIRRAAPRPGGGRCVGSSKVEPGRARFPSGHGQDLGVADDDVLVAVRRRR